MPLKPYLPSAYTPLAWVTFELEQGPVTVQVPGAASTVLPGTPLLLSVQTQKSLAQPDGKFQITLTATGIINEQRDSWVNVLRPNDRVEIRMARVALSDGSLPDEDAIVMIGLIDRVAETRGVDPQSGQPIMVATVTGTDYVKLFRQAKVTQDLYLANFFQGEAEKKQKALFLARIKELELKLHDAEQIIEILKWVSSHGLMDLHFATDGGAINFFGSSDGETHVSSIKEFADNWVFAVADGRYLTHQGDLWSLLELLANRPFCELYFDSILNKPTLVFRPTPFGPPGPMPNWPKFRELKRHILTKRHYWSTRSLQRTDADLVNVVQVYSQIMQLPLNVLPLAIKESLRLYGLRYWNPSVTIIPPAATKFQEDMIATRNANNAAEPADRVEPRKIGEDEEKQNREAIGKFNSDLGEVVLEWLGRKSRFQEESKKPPDQRKQILFKSGVLPITFSPAIRIGQAAEFQDLKEIYYIEGVSHRIEVKRSAQTVLTLTRGQLL